MTPTAVTTIGIFISGLISSLSAEPVEIWAVLLDKSLPARSPSGVHMENFSISVRILAKQEDILLNTYSAIGYRVTDGAKKVIQGSHERDVTLGPTKDNIVSLKKGHVFNLDRDGIVNRDSLILSDGIGGIHVFPIRNVKKLNIEVIYDSGDVPEGSVAEFEKRELAADAHRVFRGPIICKPIEPSIKRPKDTK